MHFLSVRNSSKNLIGINSISAHSHPEEINAITSLVFWMRTLKVTRKLSTLLKIATLVVDKGELMDPGASSCLTLMIHPEIVLTVPSIFLVQGNGSFDC